MASKAPNFIEVLRQRAEWQPGCKVFTFLGDGENETAKLTYEGLDLKARAIAGRLIGLRGERAMLVFPAGLEFIAAFFGCIYAGVVAVPVYPPRSRRLAGAFLGQVRDASPSIILTV